MNRLIGSLTMIGGALVASSFQEAAADDLYAYGEYLAGECTSCHLISGEMVGAIPPIVDIDEDYFIEAMNDYAAGFRENQAMGSVARVLDEEMIASLARYFSLQVPPEGDEEAPAETQVKSQVHSQD